MRLKDADADLKPMAASVAQSSAAVLYPLSPRYASVTAALSRSITFSLITLSIHCRARPTSRTSFCLLLEGFWFLLGQYKDRIRDDGKKCIE